jgi:hypothetical protein
LQHQGHHGHEFGADVAFQEMHGKQRPAAAAALFVANDVFRQSTQQLGLDHLFGGGGTGGDAVKKVQRESGGVLVESSFSSLAQVSKEDAPNKKIQNIDPHFNNQHRQPPKQIQKHDPNIENGPT